MANKSTTRERRRAAVSPLRPAIPARLFVATFDTRHFTFIAAGLTEQEARDTLRAGWNEHARTAGADPDYFKDNDATVVAYVAGLCMRDDTVLIAPKEG